MPRIEVQHEDVRVDARQGETVLDALRRLGYGYRVGCRRGSCGICKVDLRSGRVQYPVTVADTVLSESERRDGTCLSCRAVPIEDVVIALRNDRLRITNGLLRAALARRAARDALGSADPAPRRPPLTVPPPTGGQPCP